MKINSVIVKPLLTEKSLNKTQSNFYTFKVALKSNKNLISNEIKRLYKVDVLEVKTLIMPGKPKRVLKTKLNTKTIKWKKAVIKLNKGQTIDLFPKDK